MGFRRTERRSSQFVGSRLLIRCSLPHLRQWIFENKIIITSWDREWRPQFMCVHIHGRHFFSTFSSDPVPRMLSITTIVPVTFASIITDVDAWLLAEVTLGWKGQRYTTPKYA
ncbi:hypothetical protein BDZ94DRAFT_1260413 [Collybia nuda]|uniref:Uncharacterized protein n=1 Tax=Collybia nuda TaxID=64659 RepID=A0A9P5Y523_9AGAR|nr:hypothetical protein BDZ94DRAFT_1260413 [Collybia nuda]